MRATSGIHQKKRQVEASTSLQKLVKALDYYVVIVTGWKHHYYPGWTVYFVVWHGPAVMTRGAPIRASLSDAMGARYVEMQ